MAEPTFMDVVRKIGEALYAPHQPIIGMPGTTEADFEKMAAERSAYCDKVRAEANEAAEALLTRICRKILDTPAKPGRTYRIDSFTERDGKIIAMSEGVEIAVVEPAAPGDISFSGIPVVELDPNPKLDAMLADVRTALANDPHTKPPT